MLATGMTTKLEKIVTSKPPKIVEASAAKPEKISMTSETGNQEPIGLQHRKDWVFMCKEM
jgi:hypothetical protein